LVIFTSLSVGLVSAKIWHWLYDNLDSSQSQVQTLQSLVISIPLFVALTFSLSILLISRRLRFSVFAFSLVLISSSGGSYMANAGPFYATGVSMRTGSAEIAEPIIGSNEYRRLLEWLEVNTGNQDLVASNRQCLEVEPNPKNCQALWMLTSAISKRQNLVEGLYPQHSEIQNIERYRRMSIVIEFVENPSDENRDSLVEYGVKWVVADHAITNTRDWQPFATERYKNLAGSILELNP
jgi:hypothetical protein